MKGLSCRTGRGGIRLKECVRWKHKQKIALAKDVVELHAARIRMNQMKQTTSHYDLRRYGDLVISIVADSHGYVDPRVLEVVADSDVAIHAGDMMGKSVLDSMKPRTGLVVAVRGNNDSSNVWSDTEIDTLQQIPEIATLRCQGGKIAVEHGHRLHDIERNHFPLADKYPDARMVIYGHTHIQRLDQDSFPWLVNPGASGITRNNGGASCYRLRICARHWSVEPFKFTPIRKAG